MKKSTTKLRLLLPADAKKKITIPQPGDQVQLRYADSLELGRKQHILGYAQTPDGLTLYVAGSTSSALRTSKEFGPGFVQEKWFRDMPVTIGEILVEDYAKGHILLYPAAERKALPLMRVA